MTDDRKSASGSPTICEVLRKRYAVHLIVLLGLHGPFRFTSILDRIETVSSATISKRLDALIEAGLVERTEYDGHLRVEYSLTERGQDLCAQLDSNLIGALVGKHTFRIICWVGEQGPIRYMEIKRDLEITTDSTLSTRLEELCDAGLLDRTSYDDVPPHVEYSLTDRGTELCQASAGRVRNVAARILVQPTFLPASWRNASSVPTRTGVALWWFWWIAGRGHR